MKTTEQIQTTAQMPRTTAWFALLLSAGLLTAQFASAQTLKLRFNFEDTGTTTTDTQSGVVLNMVNNAGTATDYHGAAGTGVGGAGKALDFTSNPDGGNGALASAVNNATLGFGSVSSWTVTEWVNPSAISANLARLFILGTNTITDFTVANSVGFKVKSTSGSSAVLQVNINTTEATSVEPTISLPAGSWTFIAYTYDGTTLSMYVGSTTTAAQLVASAAYAGQSINFGTAGSLFLGNRNGKDRAFKGYIDDTRFYTGAGDANFVESVRQAGLPVIATEVWDNGAGTRNWNTTDANWNGGGKWTNANSALFGTTGVGKVSVTESITALNVTVTNAGYVITNGGGTLTISGTITNNVDVGLSAYLLGGLTKAGSGNLTISALETNTGNTIVNGGKLTIDGTLGGLYWGSVSGNVQINSGGILSFSGGMGYQSQAFKNLTPAAGTIVINGGTLQHTGNSNTKSDQAAGSGHLFDIGALGATLDSATAGQEFSLGYRYDYSGGVLTSAGGTLTLTGVGNGDLNYSLPGAGGVAMTGSGIWKLTGTNSYSGGTTISAGELSIGYYTNLPTTGTLTITNGGALQVTGTAVTNLNPYTVNWSTFNGGLDVNNSANVLTVTNVIGGSGSLTKLGSGTLTLANTNNYSGGTTISAGVLEADYTNAVGTGLLTLNGGTLSNNLSCTLTNPVSLSANSTIAASAQLKLSGAITNAGGLTKTGAGTVILTGGNTYTNATTISGGTLQIGDGTTDGSLASSASVTNNGALIYNLVGSQSYTNVISGSGTLTKTGAGTLALSGLNTFTGGTTVSNGILILTNISDCAVKAPLAVNTGGTVTVAGDTFKGFGTLASININGGTVNAVVNEPFMNNFTVNMTGGTLGPAGNEWCLNNVSINTLASASTATISGVLFIRNDYAPTAPLTFSVAAGSASPDLLVSGYIKQTVAGAAWSKTDQARWFSAT